MKEINAELDSAFSKFIRLRDSHQVGSFLYGNCSTCNKRITVWDGSYNPFAHCGHFITRAHGSVRHAPKNAYLQCAKCNTVEGGKQKEMSKHILRIHGKGTAEALFIESKSLVKLFPFEIKQKTLFLKILGSYPYANMS